MYVNTFDSFIYLTNIGNHVLVKTIDKIYW